MISVFVTQLMGSLAEYCYPLHVFPSVCVIFVSMYEWVKVRMVP
jgi:hypothetical protein